MFARKQINYLISTNNLFILSVDLWTFATGIGCVFRGATDFVARRKNYLKRHLLTVPFQMPVKWYFTSSSD
jgi:hypothetical protein